MITENIDKDGLYRLAAAVINQAREDYITSSSSRELTTLQHFVRSPLFQIYCMGVDAEPDSVILEWERERSEHFAQRLRICNRMD